MHYAYVELVQTFGEFLSSSTAIIYVRWSKKFVSSIAKLHAFSDFKLKKWSNWNYSK
jgi:hypothetical protein